MRRVILKDQSARVAFVPETTKEFVVSRSRRATQHRNRWGCDKWPRDQILGKLGDTLGVVESPLLDMSALDIFAWIVLLILVVSALSMFLAWDRYPESLPAETMNTPIQS
jgi:hypothetical protein